MHLVIGGRGLLGTALVKALIDRKLPWMASTRGMFVASPNYVLLDLLNPSCTNLPAADVVYLVAANAKLAYCEQNPEETWRVNVDGPIALAKHYRTHGAFVVFVSSEAVENCGNTAYGRQKMAAEMFMHTIDAAIVRPRRILDRADELAEFLIEVGTHRRSGVQHWQ